MSADFLKNAIKTGTGFVDLLDTILEKLGAVPIALGGIGAALSANGVGLTGDKLEYLFSGLSGKGADSPVSGILGAVVQEKDLDALKNFQERLEKSRDFVTAFQDAMKDASDRAKIFASQFEEASTENRNLAEEFSNLDEETRRLNLTQMASSHTMGDNARLIQLYNESFRSAAPNVNAAGVSQEVFNSTLVTSNSMMARYIASLNGAEASMSGFTAYTIKATAAQFALGAAAMAGQMVLGLFIGFVTSKVFSAIDDWIHRNEKLIEAGEEAKKKIDEINKTLQTQQKTVKDSAKRFAELSQGIDQLTGKNVSLTEDDYQEFLNISNQLAEVFPSLTKHYDENGNAIVDLNGDVNTIVGSLNSLLEVEEKLAREKRPKIF